MEYNIETKRQHALIKKFIDPDLYEILANMDAYLAGGAISSLFTNRKINDFDIYFQKEGDVHEVEKYFKDKPIWKRVHSSSMATTFENNSVEKVLDPLEYGKTYIINNGAVKIQLINAYYGDYKTVFNTFDFYCCMGAFLFKHQEFVFDPNFITDNLNRTLRFNCDSENNSLSTLIRVDKYKIYGYTLPLDELIKIVLSIKKMKLETLSDLKHFIIRLPSGFYKSVLRKELINDPLDKLKINFNSSNGDQLYKEFLNSPCDIDAIENIISDINSFNRHV